MDVDDPLDAYDVLLTRIQKKFEEFEAEDDGLPHRPFKRYKRETDLLYAANHFKTGAQLVTCPACHNTFVLRDVPCERCHGIGTLLCIPVEVKGGLV